MRDWFIEAKLGIFIHYGIYAVDGVAESWYFRTRPSLKYRPYMRQLEGFTAANYDPYAWAALFKEAGAKYAILTTKHHDGVALFDTRYSDLSVVNKTPAGRDLVSPFCQAMRDNGIKVGLYFSHCDWSAKDYTAKTWKPLRYFIDSKLRSGKKWERFKQFHHNQIEELLTNYGDIDLMWFDGFLERVDDWDMRGIRQWLSQIAPQLVVSRVDPASDFLTPEQQLPTIRPNMPWEFCMTINDSWGYDPTDRHTKSPEQIVRIFSEVVCMGGNLLLDVGPREDGTITQEQEHVLKRLGAFNAANSEAIWGAKGVSSDIFDGGITISRDGKTIYCFQYGFPNGSVPVYVSSTRVSAARLLKGNKTLRHVDDGDMIWVDLDKEDFIHGTAVFAIDCDRDMESAL